MLATRSVNVVCLPSKTETHKTVDFQTSVNYSVVGHVPFATKHVRQPQQKGLSPPLKKVEIKSVNCVSFVVQCVSAPSVPTAHNVVHAPLVGGCLQPFWQTWARLVANPRGVSILKEGYVLPFKLKSTLVRYPLMVSGYAHPQRDISLREAVQTLLHKKAVEMVRVRASLAFFNRLFIVPKPNQKWRPILDLSALERLHMRPIQWHLKRHWRVPESLEKEIPVPRSLHPHLLWWTKETNVLIGQPLHPFVSCHSDLYRCLKRRLGCSLRRLHGKRHLVSSRKSSSYKFPGTKSCLTSHEKIPAPSTGKVVLVATDNTTVVAYINKEGGMRSGSD